MIDSLEYVSRSIDWEYLARRYKNEDATIEDPIKGSLYNAMNRMIESFSCEHLLYYQNEFQ
jgi:hypothetical protein